jgi:hypothetical protein
MSINRIITGAAGSLAALTLVAAGFTFTTHDQALAASIDTSTSSAFGGSAKGAKPVTKPVAVKSTFGGGIVTKDSAKVLDPSSLVTLPPTTTTVETAEPTTPVVETPAPVPPTTGTVPTSLTSTGNADLDAAIARQLASTPGSVIYKVGGTCLARNFGTFGNGSIALNKPVAGTTPKVKVWVVSPGVYGFQWYSCK